MEFREPLLAAGLLMWAAVAAAERPVYKSVDPAGHVIYSDRPQGAADQRVKNWMPANVGAYAYDAAVLRAERDRLYLARLYAERRAPVPVAIYDPRGWQAARAAAPVYAYPARLARRGARDPNLPPTPAPQLERNYYYGGR